MHKSKETHKTGNIKAAFFLNVFFTVIEIVGGILTNSVAVITDAIHDLGDSLSLGLAWYFQHLSKRGRDEKYSYGYRRFSLLGAIINGIVLVSGSIFLLFETISRFMEPEEANAQGMMLLAVLGIMVNGFAAYKVSTGKTMNERMVYLHLLEDVLGWVAVMIGAILMYFFGWLWIDPVLSLLIMSFILINVFKNLRKTFQVLLQGVPIDVDLKKVKDYLASHKLVKGYHDLHVWSMDGTFNILTVHIVLIDDISGSVNPKNELKKGLVELGIDHPTIEIHEKGDLDCDLD